METTHFADDATLKRLAEIENQREKLIGALVASVSIIRAWHGDEGFDIYYAHSPEMKPIRDALVMVDGE